MAMEKVSGPLARVARMQEEARNRKKERNADSPQGDETSAENEKPAEPVASLRRKPKGDQQADFFVPTLYDVGTRDSRGIMDVAVFRLSKKDHRPNSRITYDLPDGHVTVTSGAHGMASVWDYDIVLMAISHLTESMNRYREGKGEKPGPSFRPHVGDVLKFCRRDNGGKQKDSIVGALERLGSTFVSIERKKKVKNKSVTINEGENLIAKFSALTNDDTGKVEFIEIKVADWMYREVTEGKNPDVLTVHPDYFLIDPGIGRFLYRLARRAAGKTSATWGFRTIYERSGSTSKFFEFSRMLRSIIKSNDIPEYTLSEESGKMGPMLTMTHRAMEDALPSAAKSDNDSEEQADQDDPA
ncbi:replication initiator protein A [Pseudomonas savastanoi]|uniref:Replication protein RepA n=1 Tax=Pseudomonas savastanoi pv. glycinea TaxID=318 RepID=A0A3M3FTW2_PSESG|nr:replication initiator protein A [Pseudomonas savastanoi]RMM65323.1 hypothetical protein ALQ73_200108 [Pseudomonas savastanoi pv. glycinea]